MPGKAASWAAAGMLAPYTEQIVDEAMLGLAVASLQAYPAFAAALQDASDIDIHLRLHGILEVAYDDMHAQRLLLRARAQQAQGARLTLLEDADLATYDGALARQSHCAVLSHDEGQVDNRRLGRALQEAARRAGVRIRRNCAVQSLECTPRRVSGVRTNEGFLAATYVVNALGAWSGQLAGLPEDLIVPVTPIKGQMLAVAMPQQYLHRVVWAGGVYLVPREDGRLIVGATVEDQGFDERLTAGGMHDLLHGMLRAIPGAAAFTVSETWTGLRPNTPDGRPFLGPTALDGYILATGHYRNGVLLTPITAVAVADAITGKAPIDPAFLLGRGMLAVSAKSPV
jgi:glycine oxidase